MGIRHAGCTGSEDLWALLAGSSSSCCFSIQKSFQERMMMHQHGVENTGYTRVSINCYKIPPVRSLR
ncbi:hypothetical protein OPV22_003021 [Ensete ventricosum]|uniref:Uncharacterized protein n=1 Tax=Ensete ventricosum TaxID=4639 RepID=A0AAV8RZQ0_ENSVE|nr:hypothetical protein OPV22_003021 [Ensete ventricosum]